MDAEIKDRILQAAIRVYAEKGIRFTMDDIAHELSMSKKTIYTVNRYCRTAIKTLITARSTYCRINIRTFISG